MYNCAILTMVFYPVRLVLVAIPAASVFGFELVPRDSELENQIIASWIDFEELYFGQGKGEVVSVVEQMVSIPSMPAQVFTFQSQKHLNRFRAVVNWLRPEFPNRSIALVQNEEYVFRLEKDRGDQWQLTNLAERTSESESALLESVEGAMFQTMYSPLCCGSVQFVKLWNTEGFKILDCILEKEQVRLVFQLEAMPPTESENETSSLSISDLKRGEMILDPTNGFLPVSQMFEFGTKTQGLQTIGLMVEIVYGDKHYIGKYRLPERYVTETQYSPLLTIRAEANFVWDLAGRQSKDDFTLTSFGLPEPRLSRKTFWRRNSRYVVLAIIFAGLLVVAFRSMVFRRGPFKPLIQLRPESRR